MIEDCPSSDEEAMLIVDPDLVSSPRRSPATQNDEYIRSNELCDDETFRSVTEELARLLPRQYYQTMDSNDDKLLEVLNGAIDYIAYLEKEAVSPNPFNHTINSNTNTFSDSLSNLRTLSTYNSGSPFKPQFVSNSISQRKILNSFSFTTPPTNSNFLYDPVEWRNSKPGVNTTDTGSILSAILSSNATHATLSTFPNSNSLPVSVLSPSIQTPPPSSPLSDRQSTQNDATSPDSDKLSFTLTSDKDETHSTSYHGDVSCDEDSNDSLSPTLPRRPMNGFIRYSIEQRRIMAVTHPKLDNRKISSMLGAKWRKMSIEERKPYEDQFEADLKTLRQRFPSWRYATNKTKSSSQVAMPTRLRDRRRLKRKIPPLCEILGQKKTTRRTGRKKEADSYSSRELWVECALCGRWRKLASSVDEDALPALWYCELNPDFRFNSCDIEQQKSVRHSPEADDFLSSI